MRRRGREWKEDKTYIPPPINSMRGPNPPIATNVYCYVAYFFKNKSESHRGAMAADRDHLLVDIS